MVANCNRFHLVETGDSCWALANAAGIDLTKFYALNPAVSTNCSHLLAGYYVCLAVASDGAPATTITSGTPVSAPTAVYVTSASSADAPGTSTSSASGTHVAATPSPVQVRLCVILPASG
jgi:hypothetical protein